MKILNRLKELLYSKSSLIKNIKNAGLYFLGSIVQSAFALFTQPIYSSYLSAEEFGIIGYFAAISSFFTPLFILSMTSVYLMRYFKQDEKTNKEMLFNITFYLLILNTLTLFIGYAGIYFYFKHFGVEIPLNPFAWYILIALLLNNIKSIVLINFRIRRKALSFFTYSVINTALNVGIGILFVAGFKWGAEGRMLAPIISSLILIPYSFYILRKFTAFNIKLSSFLKELKVATPLILASYAYVPITNVDRIFLERLNNLSELGLYSIGVSIAGYAQLALTALVMAFEPDIFESVVKKNKKKLIKTAGVIYLPYFAFILIFMMFSGPIIYLLTAGRYLGAQPYTNIALVSVFFIGLHGLFDKILIALEKTRLNLLINIIGGILALVIFYFGVNTFGFYGAAYGKVAVAMLMTIIGFLLVRIKLKLA